ncbi:MAG: GH92 family glycosyl hydrolase [Longimicrobiales bacterium]|nr:GH92 family glycosyl hydrolase [Longimicrobiales bacterium]
MTSGVRRPIVGVSMTPNLDPGRPLVTSALRRHSDRRRPLRRAGPALVALAGIAVSATAAAPQGVPVQEPSAYVDPLIGTANGGNTFPGAVVPFGMVQWSPETTSGDATRRPAPGGYQYDATRVRGFSLTHLSGTGCRGASGDVPFMPWVGRVEYSPSADSDDRMFSTPFEHANERAEPGAYRVRLRSGVLVELAATERTGSGRFTYPEGALAVLLVRTSDSEVGSSDAHAVVDPAARTVTGWVSSGNFCGYIHPVMRKSYYTLYFVAEFDRPFSETGSWEDGIMRPGATQARGGTGYGEGGYPEARKGSGVWVGFDPRGGSAVNVRVGISYVSLANARANLVAENPPGTTLETVRGRARASWSEALGRVRLGGGSEAGRTVFYTALYHALLHPNLFSDVNGEYAGLDGGVHTVGGAQKAQYANFSGWDVYRSQLQLVTLLAPDVASDIAQSLFNQAQQNGGVWDRWTHNAGATHVMEGDASAPAVAGIVAFGGTAWDVRGAFASLAQAARTPTALDLSAEGCPVMCPGQRPSLDKWLALGYLPTGSNSWGAAGETLEDAVADFSLAQLAGRLGDEEASGEFLLRSGGWRRLYNPDATAEAGYVQERNEDGTWPDFDPASSKGFAEGTSAQYTWMVPFDARGLFDAMGGDSVAVRRLDAFFRTGDGGWALTGLGGLHAEMGNEPSVGAAWMYLFAGRPDRTQETVRAAVATLWRDRPHGIPGNDDLGAMSSWYVWAAMGLYPGTPGRAELLLTSPLFPHVEIRRPGGVTIEVEAPGAEALPYVRRLWVDGRASTRSWLPESFVREGGRLRFELGTTPGEEWGRGRGNVPPSFPAGGR